MAEGPEGGSDKAFAASMMAGGPGDASVAATSGGNGNTDHGNLPDSEASSLEELQGMLEHIPTDELERHAGVSLVPPAHFASLGHDDNYSEHLVHHFQVDLLREVMYLAKQPGDHGEKVRIDLGREPGSHYILHDPALLPLWRAFRDALLACPGAHEYKLNVQNVHLTSKVIDMLDMALRGKQVTSIKCRNVWLRKPGFDFTSRLIRNGIRIMTTVELEGCHAGSDLESLKAIMDAVRINVNNVSLSNNGITAEGAKIIADVLAENGPLQGIWLRDNDMRDEGIAHLMRALGSNTNLKTMHIEHNGITEAGLASLEKATFDTTSLESIIHSNHTCRLHYAGLRQFRPEHLTCWGALSPSRYSENVMRQKIYSAFGINHDGPVETKYLDDVPRELIPTVLGFAERVPYYCEVNHAWMDSSGEDDRGRRISLKNVYCVVKAWVVPRVFCTEEGTAGDAEQGTKRKRGESESPER